MIFAYLIIVALAFGALGFFTAAFMASAARDDAFRAGYSAGITKTFSEGDGLAYLSGQKIDPEELRELFERIHRGPQRGSFDIIKMPPAPEEPDNYGGTQ